MRYRCFVLSTRARPSLVVLSVVVLAMLATAVGVGIALRQRGLAPDFTLTNQDGLPFSLSAQRGKAIVLFFGYTHCTDVCPLTLARIAAVIRSLGPSGDDVEPVFVTTDPDRDSPPVLRSYLARFGAPFVGLTGSSDALVKTYAAYHVFVQKLPPHAGEQGYEMAHSSALYYIDSRGALRDVGDWNDGVPAIAATVKMLVG